MDDEVRELVYRKFEETHPDLLRSAIGDKRVCLDLVRRMDDPGTFALALFVLEYYWPPDASVIERCRDLIGNNMAHEDYRATAMNYLATAQAGTKDPATIAAFIAIIGDELNIEELRTVAYYGFLRVIDHAPSLFTHLFSFSRVPETIRDIDWRLIRKWSRVCQEQQ